jgi:hypothetical protein
MPPPNHLTPTLQKLLEQTKADPILSNHEKTELASAIRCFSKICGKHPADIIADPAVIRGLITKASWQLAGLTKRSWENLKSRLTRAMKIGGIEVHRRRRNFKLLAAWDAVLAPMSRRDCDELHRFAGWCSTHSLLPTDVEQATFDRYLAYLEAQSIQRNPRERWHVARRAWNRTVAGAPGSSFPAISDGEPIKRRALPWNAFSPRLLDELENYKKAVTTTNPLDVGQREPIKPVTLEGYIRNIHWYVSDLVKDGVPPAQLASLAACVEPPRVKRGLEIHPAGRALDDKTKPGLSARMVAILSVAHHVGVSNDDEKELKRLFKKVRHVPDGMCERNEVRLAQFQDPVVLRAFANLAFKVAKRHAHVTAPTIREAQEMQLAVLLAVLLFLPVRIKNAADLDLAKHLRGPICGSAGPWLVRFAPEEVKNSKAIDGCFNEVVSALLTRYIDVFRPVLLKSPSSKLFVSQHGAGKGPKALSAQFSRFVRREIGLIVNAHLMRHFAAFAYLEANPGDLESVGRMLGHKNIATTTKFYAKASTLSALARYDEVISAQLDAGALMALSSSLSTMAAKRAKKNEVV